MPLIALLAVLVAAPSNEPIKLASPGFTGFKVAPEEAHYYTDRFAQQLTLEGVRVTTASQINSLLGFERQKALLGCSQESASCIAELAAALGVDGIVTGTIGKFGDSFQVDIQILAASDGHPLAIFSQRVQGEAALLDAYSGAARRIATELGQKLGRRVISQASAIEPASAGADSTVPLRRRAWIPAAGGAIAGVAGAVFLVQAKSHYDRLNGLDTTLSNPSAYASEGSTQQTVGIVLVSSGSAALLAAGGMYLFGAGSQTTVSAAVLPGGGEVWVSRAW